MEIKNENERKTNRIRLIKDNKIIIDNIQQCSWLWSMLAIGKKTEKIMIAAHRQRIREKMLRMSDTPEQLVMSYIAAPINWKFRYQWSLAWPFSRSVVN